MEENTKERMLQLAKQETWTKTPFSYVRTGKSLTLLQQDAMLMVSAHIQEYIRDFFDKGMNKSKEKPRSLFAQHLLENGIPPFRIYLAELGINTANYKVTRAAIEEMNLLIDHPELDENGNPTTNIIFSPVFKRFKVPTTGDYYRKTNDEGEVIVESARHSGYIDVEINNDVAQYAFDMSQGYAVHPKFIARNASKQKTPTLYFYLQEMMGKFKTNVIRSTVADVKKALGFETYKDKETGEWVTPYAKFAHFKTKVLDAVKEDLDRMAAMEPPATDITFTYEPVYNGGRKRGDPDYIEFHIISTDLGIGYNLLTGGKPSPAVSEAKEQAKAVQQELFADAEEVTAEPVKTDTLQSGAGADLWQRLLAEYDGPAKQALGEVKYLGLDDGVFCVVATDEQREVINTLGDGDLYRQARVVLGMSETSFMPPMKFRKG